MTIRIKSGAAINKELQSLIKDSLEEQRRQISENPSVLIEQVAKIRNFLKAYPHHRLLTTFKKVCIHKNGIPSDNRAIKKCSSSNCNYAHSYALASLVSGKTFEQLTLPQNKTLVPKTENPKSAAPPNLGEYRGDSQEYSKSPPPLPKQPIPPAEQSKEPAVDDVDDDDLLRIPSFEQFSKDLSQADSPQTIYLSAWSDVSPIFTTPLPLPEQAVPFQQGPNRGSSHVFEEDYKFGEPLEEPPTRAHSDKKQQPMTWEEVLRLDEPSAHIPYKEQIAQAKKNLAAFYVRVKEVRRKYLPFEAQFKKTNVKRAFCRDLMQGKKCTRIARGHHCDFITDLAAFYARHSGPFKIENCLYGYGCERLPSCTYLHPGEIPGLNLR